MSFMHFLKLSFGHLKMGLLQNFKCCNKLNKSLKLLTFLNNVNCFKPFFKCSFNFYFKLLFHSLFNLISSKKTLIGILNFFAKLFFNNRILPETFHHVFLAMILKIIHIFSTLKSSRFIHLTC